MQIEMIGDVLMPGIGTLINTAAIIAGGLFGTLAGSRFNEKLQKALNMACGVSVLFIGISGAMEGMLDAGSGGITSGRSMFVSLVLVIGTFTGELLDIEDKFERFGEWLKVKTGNAKDAQFVNAFVTASLTVCIGAMAIVGAIEDGIMGDYSILATKSVLDFVIVAVMTCSMGKGCGFSAIPVFILEGSITVLAGLISPFMTEQALANLSLIGSILIFCVGMNIVWGKMVRVANMLPALIIAVAAAFI